MLDERLIYEMIKKIPPELAVWYPTWPQSFQKITSTCSVGCWRIADDSIAISTSSHHEYATKVKIEISTWSATPEKRMALNMAINDVFGEVFFRQSCAQLAENLPGNMKAFRSIMIYTGVVNTRTNVVLMP